MKLRAILIIYVILHVLLVINGTLTPNINWNFVSGFLVCFYFSIYCLKKFNDNNATLKILMILVAIRLLLFGGYDLYIRLTEELYGSPVLILHLLGIVSGWFYLRLKQSFNLLPFIFSSIFVVFMFFQGWDYYFHKLNYGNFTGNIEAYKLLQKIEGIDQKNNQITNLTLKNKITLLDFWYTRCDGCFRAFPQLQAFYDKYMNDDSIVIIAVNKPIEEDKQKNAFKVIEEAGYDVPVLLPTDEELPEKFGVKYYPTTFVIDKQGNVVYKGDIEGAIKMVEELRKQ
jgi:thiol-disulfide isomerase/thioredoxin